MIRYDWNVLSKHPIYYIFNILYILDNKIDFKTLTREELGVIASFKDKSGFLLNFNGILSNKSKHTDSEIYLYLDLAAQRSYINYKETGDLRLPTYYIEHKYDLSRLRLNTMLTVTDEDIIFKYEEK